MKVVIKGFLEASVIVDKKITGAFINKGFIDFN